MAGRKTEPAAATPPQAAATATPAAAVLEPPATTRTRPSTADTATVADMKKLMDEGKWASNSVTYPAKNDAGNAAVVYRRAIIRAYGGNPNAKGDAVSKRIETRTWGTGNNGGAPFVFALHLRPEAVSGGAAAA